MEEKINKRSRSKMEENDFLFEKKEALVSSQVLIDGLDMMREGMAIISVKEGEEKSLKILHLNRKAQQFLQISKDSKRPEYILNNDSFKTEDDDLSVPFITNENGEINERFWKIVWKSFESKFTLSKPFEQKARENGKKGWYFIDAQFNCIGNLVVVGLIGHFHSFPMVEKRTMNLDEQQSTLRLIEMDKIAAVDITLDTENNDLISSWNTPSYNRKFFAGKDIKDKSFSNELNVPKEEIEWWSMQLIKAIETKTLSLEKGIQVDEMSKTIWVSVEIIYNQSFHKTTGEFVKCEPTDSLKDYFHQFNVLFLDITDKKGLEILANIQSKFLETSTNTMAIVEPLEDGHLFYHYVNSVAEDVLRKYWKVGKVNGKSSGELGIPLEHTILFHSVITEVKMKKTPIEKTIEHPSLGDTRFNCSVWEIGDNKFGFITTDITQLKRAENALLTNKRELEEKIRERDNAISVRSRFLATISHEIRTPLTGIIGCLQYLTDLTGLSQNTFEMIRIGSVCSEQLLNIINDVLDFSKMEENQVRLNPKPIFLQKIIEESIDVASTDSESVPLIYDAEIPLDLRILADSGRLRQIIINLLSNAKKFTERGEIIVSAKCISLENEEAESEISVKDTGIGINEKFMDSIFRPFLQGDSSITRTYGGSGLGLSICKKLVELMGGRIWFETNLGVGSTFHFTIKAKLIREQTEDSKNIAQIQKKTLELEKPFTIAIVDNCQSRMDSMEKFLSTMKLKCEKFLSVDGLMEDQKKLLTFQLLFVESYQLSISFDELYSISKDNKISLILVGQTISEAWFKKNLSTFYTLRRPFQLTQIVKLLDKIIFGNSQKSEVGKPTKRLEGLKVLLAEDNILNQKIITSMLKQIGVTFVVVDNGKEAVNAIEREGFDLILMDCMMPIMGGIEATKLIRTSSLIEQQPVILALTADAMIDHRLSCLEAGMNDVLTKPIKKEVLLTSLSAYYKS